MSVVVGTLVVDLTANTASFVSGMEKAAQISLTSAKNIQKAFDAIAPSIIGTLSAIEAAVVAMADESIKNMARLADMAQSTGIATEALSAMEYAAKQSGVSTESLDGALEKMSKSMEKAASGSQTGTNAYKTLGVAVTDAQGRLRPTVDVLEDLAARFATFKDGPEKTALAMQIFGRSGAEMVPLLNRGKEGIADLTAEAQKLGIVIDSDTAEAAKRFEESLNRLEATASGVANRFTAELLPSLQKLADNMSANVGNAESASNTLLKIAGYVGKAFIVAFGGLQTFFDSIVNSLKHFGSEVMDVFRGIGRAGAAVWHRDWQGLKDSFKQTTADIGAEDRKFVDDQKQIWAEYSAGVSEFWNAGQNKPTGKPTGTRTKDAPRVPDANAGKAQETIEKRISDLQKQAAMEIQVAAAQRDNTAATLEATAAAQAQEFIEKANADLKQKHAGHLTASQIATINAAEAEKVFAGAAKEVNKNLADTTTKTEEQTQNVIAMASAYSKGGAAIAEAQEAAQIAPFQKKVDDLAEAFELLKQKNPGATQEIARMAAALAQARAELAAAKTAFDEYADAQRKANTDRQSTDLERQIASNRQYAAAVLDSADALRQYDIQQKVLEYQRNSDFDQSAEAVENYRRQLQELYDTQDQRAIADKVHAADRQSELQKEIDMLQQLRAATVAAGQSTLAIDGLIHDAEVQKLRSYDDELLKTNSIRNGMKVWFDQFTQSGTTSAQRVNSVMTSTIDGFNNSLTSFLTTGKGNWASFAQSAVSSILGLGIQWVESHVLMAAASKVFHVNEITDSTAAMAARSAANVAEATSDAAVAAAGAFAYYSSFAPEIAADMALAQYAEGIAWAPVAAFRFGGIVPGDGSDGVPALLHPREMVLPERVSNTVMNAVNSGGGSTDSPTVVHHHYSPTINGGLASGEEISARLKDHWERFNRAEMRKRGIRF